jgi:hypothetical protein
MTELACKCGAVYEVIETEGFARDEKVFKCVVCDCELLCALAPHHAQLHLLRQPEADRE